MGFTRGNRVRETGPLRITPLRSIETAWCINEHKTNSGLLRSASHSILLMGYSFGTYCTACAKEVWETWNDILGTEAHIGVMLPKSEKSPSNSHYASAERERKRLAEKERQAGLENALLD